MRRLFIFIVGAFFLTTAALAVAAGPTTFNPKIHNEANLPMGILYVDSGTVNYVQKDKVVVDDAEYPFSYKFKLFTLDGLKISRKNLKKGQKVDLYANDKHEAVYIVLK